MNAQPNLIIDARANEDNSVLHEVAKHIYDILCTPMKCQSRCMYEELARQDTVNAYSLCPALPLGAVQSGYKVRLWGLVSSPGLCAICVADQQRQMANYIQC